TSRSATLKIARLLRTLRGRTRPPSALVGAAASREAMPVPRSLARRSAPRSLNAQPAPDGPLRLTSGQIPDQSRALEVRHDLDAACVAKCVHEAVVHGQNQILQVLVGLKTFDFQAKIDAVVNVDMTIVSLVLCIVRKPSNNFAGLVVRIRIAIEHVRFKLL